VRAVLLVGGQGTRLRPLTLTCPKPLLPVANQAFVERQLTWLATHGVDDVVLSMGYLPDAFREHFPDGRFECTAGVVSLRYAVEDEPLGTAGAIRFAAAAFEDPPDATAGTAPAGERMIVCNGDVLTDLDLGALVALHADRGAAATVALSQVEDPSAFGVVPTKPDGEVESFVEKPPRDEAPTNWINAGTYVLEPEVLDLIPAGRNVSVERETFPHLLETPGRLYALEADCYWLDVGTPALYLRAHRDVVDGRLGTPPAPGAEEISPGVWAQGTVDVAATARLTGPLLLGEGAVVAGDAVVGTSSIGRAATVGRGAVVEDSVLLEGVHVEDGSTVRGSILGRGAVLDSGAVVTDESVVGAGVTISTGSTVSAGRVPVPSD